MSRWLQMLQYRVNMANMALITEVVGDSSAARTARKCSSYVSVPVFLANLSRIVGGLPSA